ncbi:MAG TPA: carbonic anhydrase [Pyrinomonadaceae bacterium]|nr:carbonic anhydrase [Pyrinomonadaceae bacterium]
MNQVITLGKLAILFLFVAVFSVGQKTEETVSADSALAELKAGNAHHVAHRYTHPHVTPERQRELASGQHPHAQVLSCADSRVPPEVVFDQGLGDLFVVRVAGNVTSDSELGSLEYGALHLHVPLLVVLGHQHCGAVTAAVEGGEAEGHIGSLVSLIRPAVEATKGMPGDPVDNAVKANVEMTVKKLRASPIFAELIAGGKLKVVGAVYSLDTGKVTWLGD